MSPSSWRNRCLSVYSFCGTVLSLLCQHLILGGRSGEGITRRIFSLSPPSYLAPWGEMKKSMVLEERERITCTLSILALARSLGEGEKEGSLRSLVGKLGMKC